MLFRPNQSDHVANFGPFIAFLSYVRTVGAGVTHKESEVKRWGRWVLFSPHWLCEILGPACITLVNRKRKRERQRRRGGGRKEETREGNMTSHKARGLALKRLSDLIVLSGRNHPDNGVWKGFLVHTYPQVSTTEAFVVAVVDEYSVADWNAPFVHFRFIP